MDSENKLFHIHKFYNLSRYLFLNIEWNYNNLVEESGITLPQLRVLWIIKIFQGVSLGEIAKIGCWSPPTVTKMLKILMDKKWVIREETTNKKLYALKLSEDGHEVIRKNQLKKTDILPLLQLISFEEKDDLSFAIETFTAIGIEWNNFFLFEYIEKINELGLKIDLTDFNSEYVLLIKKLVCFYNLLRTFILTIENNHRKLLEPFNITYPQLRALWIIDAFPGITSIKLSELAYWAPSTANMIVKNLYEKGLVYKEKSKLKNSLYLYVSNLGEELLVKEFDMNQKSLLIYKDINFLSVNELEKLNNFMFQMNTKIKNDFVKEYIEKTFTVIEKRLL